MFRRVRIECLYYVIFLVVRCMSHRQGEDTVLLLEKLSFVFGLLHVQTPVLSTVVPPNCFSANIFNEGVPQT